MRKPELAAAIAEKADLTKEQANRVLNAVLEEITGALHRKDSVTLVGFGTFLQRHRGARTGKNPQTGEPVKIKASISHWNGLINISYIIQWIGINRNMTDRNMSLSCLNLRCR